MPRAPREQAVEQPPDRPAPAPVRAPTLEGPAAVMFLQSTAGNQAVARSLARRALQREPASPGVDHAADASNVTITFLMRDLNLKSRDASTIDFLHEPGVSFQVAPKEAPQPVVQAALSAMNLHLQRHGKDLVELSVDPQASIGGDKPTVGAQLQAEFHVSSTFSMTAGSLGRSRPSVSSPSRASTTSMPEVTLPKTVCLPSSHGAASVVTMKNCEPFVLGPAFAIASAPRTTLWSLISSSNV